MVKNRTLFGTMIQVSKNRLNNSARRFFLRRLSSLRCNGSKDPAMNSVLEYASKGVPILGVCNGFQILTEVGLLPGALIRNKNLKFICRNVSIKVEVDDSIFTSRYSKGQILSIPVAHNDGNYFASKVFYRNYMTRVRSPSSILINRAE